MAKPPISFDRFVQMLSKVLMSEPEHVTPDALLVAELGLQSIDLVQMVEMVESELRTDLAGLDLSRVETVEELYWELVAGGDDGGDSVVAGMASAAASAKGQPHELALRKWLPQDPMADVDTLIGLVARRAAVTPDRVAVDFCGAELTYRGLARQVAQVAGALARHGVKKGDRVILVMPNSLEFFAAFYGAQHLRAVAVPLFHVPQPERIARIARHCDAKVVVSLRPFARPLRQALDAALGSDGAALLDMPSLLTEPLIAGLQLPQPEPDDLAMLQYTSGTTGDAKGVMLTHRALMANIRQVIPHARCTRDEVFVSWLPVYHDMGLITLTMMPLYLGAKLVLLPVQLKPDAWFTAIEQHRGTFTAAPDFAYRYALRVGGDLSRYDLSTLRVAYVAAEPVRARTIARFEAELGIPGVLKAGYGLAESCVAVAFCPPGDEPLRVDADGYVSVGPAIPGAELSIRGLEGELLPAGTAGEICLNAPSLTRGYYRNPEATRALFTADGHVCTGDIGYLDAAGNLTIVDRIKNVIIVGGRTLSPRELEEVCDGLEGVVAAMAVGLDAGGDAGEQVELVVETEERDDDARRAIGLGVRQAVQERMGVRVHQVHVVPRATIPRTYNGKLQYAVMRARLRASGSPLA